MRVLILGSFPGTRSLAERRYYAHERNRFWPTLASFCGASQGAPYEDRLSAIALRGIGLWDVLHACRRRGSLDQAIVRGSEEPNDLGSAIEAHAELRAVLINGQSAGALFARHVLPRAYWNDAGLAIEVMPSTSPAHAAMSLPRLLTSWHERLERYALPVALQLAP